MNGLKRVLVLILVLAVWAGEGRAGWLHEGQAGFLIQVYTTTDPILGINSGTIVTNGSAFQFCGNSSGLVAFLAPGAEFRGLNAGTVYLGAEGSAALGQFAALATVTNLGKGSLVLANLTTGQKAVITDVAHGSLLVGAGVCSNAQSIVAGDGYGSHGFRSVTAGSFWAMDGGFFGNGAGLTNLVELDLVALAAVSAHAALTAGAHGVPVNRYVSTSGSSVSPFTTWATAATNIQAAVDVALPGETVWVSNGVYADGARVVGGVSNRVAVTNAVTIRSVNGPGVTRIQGAVGVRGVYLAAGATMSGMTITNGGSPSMSGGGVYGGTVFDCTLANNIGNCGGGAYTSRLERCIVRNNDGPAAGGVFGCEVFNCLLVGNTSDYAAATLCTLYNCTLVNNTGDAGSARYCSVVNSLLWGNSNDSDGTSTFAYSQAPGIAGHGVGNVSDEPIFVDAEEGNYRIRHNDAGVNAGTNGAWTVGAVDLDGQARVYPAGGRVDMGAYEAVSDALAWHQGDSVVTAGQAFGLGSMGLLMIRNGTQLVFVAGAVTNVLDIDITHP